MTISGALWVTRGANAKNGKKMCAALSLWPRITRLRWKAKTLVLIDDVMTTGAIAEECSRVLLAAGAEHVHVLTLSRVKSVV